MGVEPGTLLQRTRRDSSPDAIQTAAGGGTVGIPAGQIIEAAAMHGDFPKVTPNGANGGILARIPALADRLVTHRQSDPTACGSIRTRRDQMPSRVAQMQVFAIILASLVRPASVRGPTARRTTTARWPLRAELSLCCRSRTRGDPGTTDERETFRPKRRNPAE
jgi:hypothetical protein